jgi:hypothetical protein
MSQGRPWRFDGDGSLLRPGAGRTEFDWRTSFDLQP